MADATAAARMYMVQAPESDAIMPELSGRPNPDDVSKLKQFTKYDPQIYEELKFSHFIQEHQHTANDLVSVNWNDMTVKGNKDLIQQLVKDFEDDIVEMDVNLKEPGMEKLLFDDNGKKNVNVLSYIKKMLSKKVGLHFFDYMPDDNNSDRLKVKIYCRSANDASHAKTLIENGFCSFQKLDLSSDSKQIIKEWIEKKKLIKTVDVIGNTIITCTSDVKQKIDTEERKTRTNTFPVPKKIARFLTRKKQLLETIARETHVGISFNLQENSLVLEGTHADIKLAMDRIKSNIFVDYITIPTHPNNKLAVEFNKITDGHECSWEVRAKRDLQHVGQLDGCEYIASWYDCTRCSSLTVIRGDSWDLNVNCLIVLCDDNLIPMQIQQGKEMDAQIQEHLKFANRSFDVGEMLEFPKCPDTNYRHAVFLVAGLSRPPDKNANKTFYGLSSSLKAIVNSAVKKQWTTICLPAFIKKGFLSTSIIVEAYLEAAIAFQRGKKALQFYLFCETGKAGEMKDLLEITRKRYKKEIGFYRKLHKHGTLDLKGLKDSRPCIEVIRESIETMKVEAIVNTTSPCLDLKAGKVSSKLLSLAGEELQRDCSKQYRKGIDHTTVVVTPPYGLKHSNRCINHVFHGALPQFKRESYVLNVKRFVWCCLAEADRQRCKSIAFPALGTGSLGYPGREAAKAMFEAVDEYRNDAVNPCVERVVFSLYAGDKDICMVFEREENRRVALGDIKKTKSNLQPFKESKPNVRKLIGTISRSPHPVEVILGVGTDIDPLNSNVVEIKFYQSSESDIKWKYSDEKPTTQNDQLIVADGEKKQPALFSVSVGGKPSGFYFKTAVTNALKYCIDNNIAEIAFDIRGDDAKVSIVANELEACLSGNKDSKPPVVLHTVYIRLMDPQQFDSVADAILKKTWFSTAQSLCKSVNPLGSKLNWQMHDSSVNDKEVKIEIVGESAEILQQVKKEMEQVSKTYPETHSALGQNHGSSVDQGYSGGGSNQGHNGARPNQDYNGARPKTNNRTKGDDSKLADVSGRDVEPQQEDLSGRSHENDDGLSWSEESEDGFELNEAFKVSARINPGFIKFKKEYRDFERWRGLVEGVYGVTMTDEYSGCVVLGTYHQIRNTKSYLDKRFPADPKPIRRKKRQPSKIEANTEQEQLNVNPEYFDSKESLILPGGEMECLLFMNIASRLYREKSLQMRYDNEQGGLVVTLTESKTFMKKMKKTFEAHIKSLRKIEVKLLGMDETSQGDAAVSHAIRHDVDHTAYCRFIPPDDTIIIIGADEQAARTAEKRILEFLGRGTAEYVRDDEIAIQQFSPEPTKQSNNNKRMKRSEGITVKIYQCSIQDLSMDCLVVPYSERNLPLTERVIQEAGNKVRKAIQKSVQDFGAMSSGECRVVDSGKLKCYRKIIFMCLDEKRNGVSIHLLQEAVLNSLKKASEIGLAKVAVLLTGINDKFILTHAEQYFDAVKEFTRYPRQRNSVTEIHLIHHNKECTNVAMETFRRMSQRQGIESQGNDFVFLTSNLQQ